MNLRGVGPGTNIAVFKVNLNWENPELEPDYVNLAMPSANPRWFTNFNFPKLPANLLNNKGESIYEAPIKGHSEQGLIQALESWGISGAVQSGDRAAGQDQGGDESRVLERGRQWQHGGRGRSPACAVTLADGGNRERLRAGRGRGSRRRGVVQ
jgi:hypothetical protein